MDIKITPSSLSGELSAISSKSLAHRYLISSALSDKPTEITVNNCSDDVLATVSCLNALGANIVQTKSGYSVTPIDKNSVKLSDNGELVLDVKESATTLRLIMPVACALYGKIKFIGNGSIKKRPLSDIIGAMKTVGFSGEFLPLSTNGIFKGNDFFVSGKISSQFLSGILIALPILGGGHVSTSELTSKPYIKLTTSVLGRFGINITRKGDHYFVSGSYTSPEKVLVGGDWSSASSFFGANALGSDINISNLYQDGQGDSAIISLSQEILKGNATIDAKDIPDLVPTLSVLACFANGKTVIKNAGRLRLKESDRITALAVNLNNMGGKVKETEDGLIIEKSPLKGGCFTDSFGDHRIAMAITLASLFAKEPTVLLSAECVKKSYPEFFNDVKKLGGKIDVL